MLVVAGKTDVIAYFYIVGDASNANPGDPITGLLFSDIETGGSASHMRQGGVRVDLTLITQTVAGIHADGGFVEVDSANMPGVYRCDFPDAAFIAGVDQVILNLKADASNDASIAPILVDLSDPAQFGIAKNVALSDIPFYMVDSTDHITPKTGLSITEEVSKNGEAFAAAAGTTTEIGNGAYGFDATAADMDADILVFRFTATGADPQLVTIKTIS